MLIMDRLAIGGSFAETIKKIADILGIEAVILK